MTTQQELRDIALAEFATAGYTATSLQRIAEVAGVSKANVLYHFKSKEAILDAAVGPALDRMAAILQPDSFTSERRPEFLEAFVDILLDHRLEVNLFINQGASLQDVPVIERANRLITRLVDYLASTSSSLEDRMRFGIALGGAAYTLCTVWMTLEAQPPRDELRASLLTILGDLLAGVGSLEGAR